MTIKAIGETPSGRKIQIARLELDVVQCGYCQPGQVMSASALLDRDPNPTMPASMRLWSATYVAAVRISVYEPRLSMRPNQWGAGLARLVVSESMTISLMVGLSPVEKPPQTYGIAGIRDMAS